MSTREITEPEELTSDSSPVPGGERAGFAARLDGDAVLVCSGELDPVTQPALRRSLNRVIRLAPDRVIVDLSRVSFFDAGAIREFVRARKASRAGGGDLVLRAPSVLGRRVLKIVGLTNLITDESRASSSPDSHVDMSGHLDELIAAWEVACATDRFGAAPPVFDPRALISAVLSDDRSSGTQEAGPLAVPMTRADDPSAATAVMQLWALRDVIHDWIDTNRTRSQHERRRRGDLDAALAEMASAALAELEQATLLDPLTGLLNRRALDRDLVQSLAAARRHGQCLSVVMVDVEGLKATNDRLGHAAGDDSLREVASTLTSALRAGDNAYRIGGDEFVLVLPELCPDDVDGVMERTVVGARGAFTWGCAWVKGDDDGSSDAERASYLLHLADQRMLDYRTRARGSRGRVDAHAGPAPASGQPAVELAGRFAAGNQSHVVIAEAEGFIAEHFDIGVDEAANLLGSFAAAEDESSLAVAVALMARTIDVARLTAHLPEQPEAGANEVLDAGASSARS